MSEAGVPRTPSHSARRAGLDLTRCALLPGAPPVMLAGYSVAHTCPTLCDPLWTAARQASLSFTISQSVLKLTSIDW